MALIPAAASGAPARDQWTFRVPARPAGHPGPSRHIYTVPEAPRSPACAGGFCVHWVAEGLSAPNLSDSNGDGIPDFVEQVQRVALHVQSVENGRLGWRRPKPDGRRGGQRGKTDVYLKQIRHGLFGYAVPDRGQANGAHRLPRRLYGYLVLDNDYARSEFPDTTQTGDLEVTLAHEYDHILQMGYDAYQDAWFAEASAVWMEDQVYDGVDDYLRYMRAWAHLFDTPLTTSSIREYGSAVWNEWLAHRYGRDIVRSAWARSIHTRPAGFSVAAYDSAIEAAGGSGFSRDFARFARDLAEWRTGSVFREGRLYPDLPRQGRLPRDGRPVRRSLNHTTFQLLRVHARGGRAVVATAVAPRGVAAGLALVGRIGSMRHGRAVSRLRFRRRGGRMTVRLGRPHRFARVTVVVVNAGTRAIGFSPRSFDWNYLTDTAPFRVRARVVR